MMPSKQPIARDVAGTTGTEFLLDPYWIDVDTESTCTQSSEHVMEIEVADVCTFYTREFITHISKSKYNAVDVRARFECKIIKDFSIGLMNSGEHFGVDYDYTTDVWELFHEDRSNMVVVPSIDMGSFYLFEIGLTLWRIAANSYMSKMRFIAGGKLINYMPRDGPFSWSIDDSDWYLYMYATTLNGEIELISWALELF